MESPATLSRDEFNRACQEFTRESSGVTNGANNKYIDTFGGWTWSDHSTFTGWGYLKRATSSIVSHSQYPEDALLDDAGELVEDEDESCAPTNESGVGRVYFHESIVWHPTYMVPAYYFQAVDSGGSPVPLDQIIHTDRFRRRTLLDTAVDITTFGVQPRENSNAQFPLLSQGDHPILGTPHWYFHPCETSAAVKEILSQTLDIPWDPNNTECLARWFKAWLAVLTTAIDLNR